MRDVTFFFFHHQIIYDFKSLSIVQVSGSLFRLVPKFNWEPKDPWAVVWTVWLSFAHLIYLCTYTTGTNTSGPTMLANSVEGSLPHIVSSKIVYLAWKGFSVKWPGSTQRDTNDKSCSSCLKDKDRSFSASFITSFSKANAGLCFMRGKEKITSFSCL